MTSTPPSEPKLFIYPEAALENFNGVPKLLLGTPGQSKSITASSSKLPNPDLRVYYFAMSDIAGLQPLNNMLTLYIANPDGSSKQLFGYYSVRTSAVSGAGLTSGNGTWESVPTKSHGWKLVGFHASPVTEFYIVTPSGCKSWDPGAIPISATDGSFGPITISHPTKPSVTIPRGSLATLQHRLVKGVGEGWTVQPFHLSYKGSQWVEGDMSLMVGTADSATEGYTITENRTVVLQIWIMCDLGRCIRANMADADNDVCPKTPCGNIYLTLLVPIQIHSLLSKTTYRPAYSS